MADAGDAGEAPVYVDPTGPVGAADGRARASSSSAASKRVRPMPPAAADPSRASRGERLAAGAARLARSRLSVRALEALAVVATLASLVFFALRLLPGDPARLVLGDEASASDLARVRATLHLDEPLLGPVRPVPARAGHPGPRRLLPPPRHERDGPGGPGAGPDERARAGGRGPRARCSASRRPCSRADRGCRSGGDGGSSKASWPWPQRPWSRSRPLLTWVLAARARRRAAAGDPDAGVAGLLFAGVLLAIPLGAHVGRIARAALAEVARAPFLAVARAKGGSPLRVWCLHALPPVVGPIVTVVATQLGALLGGAVVLERMFERRGLGTLILEAYSTRDLPVLEGAVVASGLLFVAAQALGTWCTSRSIRARGRADDARARATVEPAPRPARPPRRDRRRVAAGRAARPGSPAASIPRAPGARPRRLARWGAGRRGSTCSRWCRRECSGASPSRSVVALVGFGRALRSGPRRRWPGDAPSASSSARATCCRPSRASSSRSQCSAPCEPRRACTSGPCSS